MRLRTPLKNWPLATWNLLIVSIPSKCFLAYCPSSPFLPTFIPSLHLPPPLPFLVCACVRMARQRKNRHGWSVCSHSSLPLDFCCIFFRCQNVLIYQLCSTYLLTHHHLRGFFFTTLYVMLLEGLTGQAHPSFMWVSEDKMYVILLYSTVQLVFCPTTFFSHPLMMVHAYTF